MAGVAKSEASPRIKQLSCFLENRVGALKMLVTTLQEEGIRICAISILEAADHAVVRLVVDRPGVAREAMTRSGYVVFVKELLGVALPAGAEDGIRKVLACLLRAELNVRYVYSLMIHSADQPVLAVNVEDQEEASKILERAGLHLVSQKEIGLQDHS